MFRRFLTISVWVFAAVFLFVLFLPSIVSISHVNRFIFSCVNSHFPGKLYAQEVKVGWTDGIHVKDLEFVDATGQNRASVKKIDCDMPLLSLIHAPDVAGTIDVDAPKIALAEYDLLVSDLQLHLDIEPERKAQVDLTCRLLTKDGEDGQVALKASATNFHELEQAYKNALAGTSGTALSTVELDCVIDGLPVKALEPYIQSSLLVPAIGQRLDATIKHALHGDTLSLVVNLTSDNLNGSLDLGEPGWLKWKIMPELLAQLDKNYVQEKPALLSATIVPQSGKAPAAISWTLDSPLVIKNSAWSSPLQIKTQGKITSSDLKEKLLCNATVDLLADKETTNIRLDAEVQKPLDDPLGTLSINVEPFTIGSHEVKDAQVLVERPKNGPLTITTTALVDKEYPIAARCPLQISSEEISSSDFQGTVGKWNFSLPFNLNLSSKKIDGKLLAATDETKLESSFSCLPQPMHLKLDGKMQQFPTKLLSSDLAALWGQKIDARWNIGFDNGLSEQPIILSLTGEGLQLEANLKLGKELTSKNAFDLEWQVTPERFSALQEMLKKQKQLTLQEPVTLKAHINTIKMPIAPIAQKGKAIVLSELLDALELDCSISIAEIALAPSEGTKLVIAPLDGSAQLLGKERKIAFLVNSQRSANEKAARLFLSGVAHNLWNEQGIDVSQAKVVLDTKIQNLPLDIFHIITAKPDTADKLVAVLGANVDAHLKGTINELREGHFEGQIDSPRLKSEVALTLKKGTLHLQKPLTAEYTLTPEAGEVLLKDVNPLLVTAARSQAPIKLWIDSKDFFIPLRPFSKKEMVIGNIKIEPGVLTCKNGGMLSLLVSLLKVDTSSGNEVNLLFTPIYVEVKNGIVNAKRSDALLADAFPIATWGTIDLEKDKVDMTLGLSGAAISRAFDIAAIDPEYLVQIPIHGPTKSPKIDSARATAKITALKMQQNKNNTTALLGGLLEVATSLGEKEEPPPLPTTYPFPWNKSQKRGSV